MTVFQPVGGWLESLCWRVYGITSGKDLEHPSDVVVKSVAGCYTGKNRKVGNWPESGEDGSDVDHISSN